MLGGEAVALRVASSHLIRWDDESTRGKKDGILRFAASLKILNRKDPLPSARASGRLKSNHVSKTHTVSRAMLIQRPALAKTEHVIAHNGLTMRNSDAGAKNCSSDFGQAEVACAFTHIACGSVHISMNDSAQTGSPDRQVARSASVCDLAVNPTARSPVRSVARSETCGQRRAGSGDPRTAGAEVCGVGRPAHSVGDLRSESCGVGRPAHSGTGRETCAQRGQVGRPAHSVTVRRSCGVGRPAHSVDGRETVTAWTGRETRAQRAVRGVRGRETRAQRGQVGRPAHSVDRSGDPRTACSRTRKSAGSLPTSASSSKLCEKALT